MSPTEWIVILIAGAGGYWLVSFLLKGRKVQTPEAPRTLESESLLSEPAADAQVKPWWAVLEVPQDATAEQVREAYQRQMAQYHPDKVTTLGPEIREVALRKTQEIIAAYQAGCAARAP